MTFIHELPGWPDLTWDSDALAAPLAAVRHAQGLHLGRMQSLGFELRAEAGQERFYSLSSQIEAERKQFYLELESVQRGDLDITPWLAWFLGCLGRAIAQAEHLLARVLRKARVWQLANQGPVNERQRTVLNRLLDDFKWHLTSSKYAKLARCSTDTALRDLRDLLERVVLVQNPGGGRSTRYRIAHDD